MYHVCLFITAAHIPVGQRSTYAGTGSAEKWVAACVYVCIHVCTCNYLNAGRNAGTVPYLVTTHNWGWRWEVMAPGYNYGARLACLFPFFCPVSSQISIQNLQLDFRISSSSRTSAPTNNPTTPQKKKKKNYPQPWQDAAGIFVSATATAGELFSSPPRTIGRRR